MTITNSFFNDLTFKSSVSFYIYDDYEDNYVKHMNIDISYFNDNNNEVKIGTLFCRLYNIEDLWLLESVDPEICAISLIDDDNADAISIVSKVSNKYNINVDLEDVISYIDNIILDDQYRNIGIEKYILSNFSSIIKRLIWRTPSFVVMCATEEEIMWMPEGTRYVDVDDTVTYCCLYSTYLDNLDKHNNNNLSKE